MRVVLTGASGFIGKNLRIALGEHQSIEVVALGHQEDDATVKARLAQADAVIHLAGVNRPGSAGEYVSGNTDHTAALCASLTSVGRPIPVLFASSIHAERDDAYGNSKRLAEDHLIAYADAAGAALAIYRLPGVFGKWCRPDYNSVVATFCHDIARGNPVRIDDPEAEIQLVYIDDLIRAWVAQLRTPVTGLSWPVIEPTYCISVGDLRRQIELFRAGRETLEIDAVGAGLTRALYATYVSYLPTEAFSYPLTRREDSRGVFVEMLKTRNSGQFSYFTSHPGETRGGHYHHSKSEKFLVLSGRARFRFGT